MWTGRYVLVIPARYPVKGASLGPDLHERGSGARDSHAGRKAVTVAGCGQDHDSGGSRTPRRDPADGAPPAPRRDHGLEVGGTAAGGPLPAAARGRAHRAHRPVIPSGPCLTP
ncbi:hypothetical protein SPRI_6004 [Streptomyces pristinaespiralis]|uniref:Uncharacterized protein n=1 Tax=Streptomyces pristinaespiralis TaxID=38300 RepID=A0A0M4DKL9_STRPR|nr:hypothetical protein SPRI_6004 [Streptomyces pristinaespiralis]